MTDELQHLTREELYQRLVELKKKVKYGLVWEDKPEEVQEKCETNYPVLTEILEKEVKNEEKVDDLNHILIEGDNYHALQTLNYTHTGKIDVIYIDPPYNTGNKDFTYNDRYIDKEDVFRHSTWLSFMSKRLELARNLLSEKGVIFISIGDDEFAQLKLLCDSIFGENSFINTFIWHKKYGGGNDNKNAIIEHEYVFCYSKTENSNQVLSDLEIDFNDIAKYETDDQGNYFTASESILMRGPNSTPDKRPNLCYEILDPDKNKILPRDGKGTWCYSKITLSLKLELGDLIWKKTNNKWMLYKKQFMYLDENEIRGKKARSVLNYRYSIGQTGEGKNTIKDIFGSDQFSYPKPISLIKHLLKISTNQNSIILDFMAGSGTTGQAVLDLNREDGGSRQFILCTNNELNGMGSQLANENRPTDMSDDDFVRWRERYGICQRVAHPRLQKVMQGYFNSKGVTVAGLGGNLRYFQTSFVPKTPSRDQNSENMVSKCTEMLCLKENVFGMVFEGSDYKIFHSNHKTLGVYYSLSLADIQEFKEKIMEYEGEKVIYCFGLEYEVDPELLEVLDDLNSVRVEPIPEKILDMYEQIGKYSRL